jgi:hypothetical protein
MPHRPESESNLRPQGQRAPVGPASRPPSPGRGGADGGFSSPASNADFAESVRRLERKRRALERTPPGSGGNVALPLSDHYYVRATWSSFNLDGMAVGEPEVRDALSQTSAGQALRSRQSQRLRNHAAILHHIEADLRQATALTTGGVIRWYTTISAGLCTTSLDHSTTARLEEQVRRINSPQLRVSASIPEVAAVHVGLLADPLVPSFNGILARLLLRYHLGRCGLPPVVFDPAKDLRAMSSDEMARRIIELLEATCDEVLARRG